MVHRILGWTKWSTDAHTHAAAGARFVTPQWGTKEACEVRGRCAAAFSTGKAARGGPEISPGLKVSLVRAPPKRALLGVLAVKYERKGAYVPYLYAGICVRALFPKTAGLSTRSLLLAPRSWRLRARRGDALMRHEVSCLLDLKSVFTHCPSATAAAAWLCVSQRSSSLKKHG